MWSKVGASCMAAPNKITRTCGEILIFMASWLGTVEGIIKLPTLDEFLFAGII